MLIIVSYVRFKRRVKYSSNGNVIVVESFKQDREVDVSVIGAWVLIVCSFLFLIAVPIIIARFA